MGWFTSISLRYRTLEASLHFDKQGLWQPIIWFYEHFPQDIARWNLPPFWLIRLVPTHGMVYKHISTILHAEFFPFSLTNKSSANSCHGLQAYPHDITRWVFSLVWLTKLVSTYGMVYKHILIISHIENILPSLTDNVCAKTWYGLQAYPNDIARWELSLQFD